MTEFTDFESKLKKLSVGKTAYLLVDENETIRYNIICVPNGYLFNLSAYHNEAWHYSSIFVPR